MPSYVELNKKLYRRRFVRYSWKANNIPPLLKKLEDFQVEKIDKRDWDKVWYVRDGSFIMLENCWRIKKNKEWVADVTPHKLLVSEKYPQVFEILRKYYPRKISLGWIMYALFIVLILFLTVKTVIF